VIGNLGKALVIGGTTEGGLGEQIARELRLRDHYDFESEATLDIKTLVPDREELDVSDQSHINDYVSHNGPFDFIIYCAGVNQLKWVEDIEQNRAMYEFTVNALGFALVFQAHEYHFPGWRGSAVAIASDAARNAMRGSLLYCSSKAALVQSVRCLARELSPRWRVNAVSPSIIEDTPMTQYIDETVPGFRGWDPEEMRKYERTQLPLGRRATRQEVASVVISTLFGPIYQTGSDVHVSGGK
jgi:3-oxoacyl-[acyl-carrier protein] reductase